MFFFNFWCTPLKNQHGIQKIKKGKSSSIHIHFLGSFAVTCPRCNQSKSSSPIPWHSWQFFLCFQVSTTPKFPRCLAPITIALRGGFTEKTRSRDREYYIRSWKAGETQASWWLNQPIWKVWSSNWIVSPNRGEHKESLKPPPSRGRYI